MVATEDIGAEVAKLLANEWNGKRFIELGSMVSSDETDHRWFQDSARFALPTFTGY
jgi:hypothetical protein